MATIDGFEDLDRMATVQLWNPSDNNITQVRHGAEGPLRPLEYTFEMTV